MTDRPTHAPMFARSHDDAEPGVVKNADLDEEPHYRPKPVPTRTMREAHAKGCGPEALGVTGE
jgi:hypothetical protein